MPPVNFDPNFTFGSVMTAVSEFKELLEEVYQGGFFNIYEKGGELNKLMSISGQRLCQLRSLIKLSTLFWLFLLQ